MVEFKLQHGRVRELEANDLSTLIRMSQDKDVQEFYFAKDVHSMKEFWQEILEDQLDYRSNNGWIRPAYFLPIEHYGTIKGILTFNIDPYVQWSSRDSGPDRHEVELSYFLGLEYRRQGIMKEVLKLAIPFAFSKLNAGIVCGVCLKENIISQNLLEKVGLEKKCEGVSQQKRAKGREVVVYRGNLSEYSRANEMRKNRTLHTPF